MTTVSLFELWKMEKNVVTTDEAMFYMDESYGRRRVCYVRSNETDFNKLKLSKND